jgi:hypothetical protein
MRIRSWLIGAIALAVVPPILCWPLSRTVWMAVDLWLHPLEPWETADADLHARQMNSMESRNAT